MKNFWVLFLVLITAGQVFAYEYYWEPTGNKNLKIDAGSYVKRPDGDFFNVKDIKQNKVYTMQHYIEYSDTDKRFYHYLGTAQTCPLEEYIEFGREVCSPVMAKPAEQFERIDAGNTGGYKRLMVTLPAVRAEYSIKKPDYWVNLYYSNDITERVKKALVVNLKEAKKNKEFPKLKKSQKIFVDIAYKILPDGTLQNAEIVDSSGDEFFNKELLKSFNEAEPFLVFPLSSDLQVLNGNLRYELIYHSHRYIDVKFIQSFD